MGVYSPSTPKPYRDTAVLTASPGRLVVMQYDGARRFLFQACAAKSEGQIELAHRKLQRAEAIIDNLRNTLDMSQGEIAERLQSIYIFCGRHLNEARLGRDPDKIERVDGLLCELRDAWAQAARL